MIILISSFIMQIGVESNEDTVTNVQHNIHSVSGGNINNVENQIKSECSQHILDRERTVVLLRKELEYALDSLKVVQAQMVKLIHEKEEIKQSEVQSQTNTERLTVEILRLKSEIVDKEQQFELRLVELEEKLQRVEGSAVASNVCWRKMKEVGTLLLLLVCFQDHKEVPMRDGTSYYLFS